MHLYEHFGWIVVSKPKPYNSSHCHRRNRNLTRISKIKQVVVGRVNTAIAETEKKEGIHIRFRFAKICAYPRRGHL